jgi:putative phosphoribosyl transferase
MANPFLNRKEAGKVLARKLEHYAGRSDLLVLALPRGGVPVGYEVAKALQAPLDVFVVRKLGVQGHEELAFGAIASGGVRVFNDPLVKKLQISDTAIEQVTAREQDELIRREQLFRGDRPAIDAQGKTTILVDDGLATGASMRAAIQALKELQPAKIVVAVPIGSPETCEEVGREVDEIVCARTPAPFLAVGFWYNNFTQTTDAEVRELLGLSRAYARIHYNDDAHVVGKDHY